VKGE
jgi:predicted peroxiredoxin